MEQIKTQNLIIGFGKAGKTLAADLAKNGLVLSRQRIATQKPPTRYITKSALSLPF